ncbi:MAG: DUF2892 domain-containing protein [candidate division WOR-3 bacterium]|nr:MAG: DUF2892 domain-containing protein [candidate division WOR-3 bacterium]
MKLNMSMWDRLIRILITVVIVILLIADVLKGMLGVVLGIIAIVFLATSVIGFCPLYVIFGFSTKKKIP